MAPAKQNLGDVGEQLACDFLKTKGYEILERNYRYGHGELDIIAKDGEMLVFVEVKTRQSQNYGPPEYSLTYGKQKQLRHIAEGYFYEHNIAEHACRFDVVTIEFLNNTHQINHIEHAFTFYDR